MKMKAAKKENEIYNGKLHWAVVTNTQNSYKYHCAYVIGVYNLISRCIRTAC